MARKYLVIAMVCLVAVTFLISGCEDSKKVKQLESDSARLNQMIAQKDSKIASLTNDLNAARQAVNSVSAELVNTKKALDDANNKLNAAVVKPAVPQK